MPVAAFILFQKLLPSLPLNHAELRQHAATAYEALASLLLARSLHDVGRFTLSKVPTQYIFDMSLCKHVAQHGVMQDRRGDLRCRGGDRRRRVPAPGEGLEAGRHAVRHACRAQEEHGPGHGGCARQTLPAAQRHHSEHLECTRSPLVS